MDKTTVVISKKFNGAAVQVRVTNTELSISISLSDFISTLAGVAKDGVVTAAAEYAGNPTMLVTNAQLVQRLKSTSTAESVAQALLAASASVVNDLKSHSVAAQ